MNKIRLLKIIGLGIIFWGLSLVWLDLNHIVTSLPVLGALIGFTIILPAYFIGRQFGKHGTHATPESLFPTGSARLGSVVYARNHHSLPTRPMAVVQTLHSRPTRPMPINLSR